jgi:hypothetical protein
MAFQVSSLFVDSVVANGGAHWRGLGVWPFQLSSSFVECSGECKSTYVGDLGFGLSRYLGRL